MSVNKVAVVERDISETIRSWFGDMSVMEVVVRVWVGTDAPVGRLG
jgi:hypothetical protein